ncbi:mannitol dehydrogenase [Micromonospora globispora]|uniref:mannitol dehydrogenase family protein n=1 Tax=Micromonospora globispora TaxID=1450148 RepID=UPI000D702B63|nr:mannitol dehydrogenase family protein [Micromonospora globispora]PWU58555.1 mannitol dehydrogenase [Micromonospora globispora]RQW83775.1 mannitol dehydrogenase [Micromonospora globispora]
MAARGGAVSNEVAVGRRLGLDTLDRLGGQRRGWIGPAVDPRALRVGIVHLGIGAFHRAHQAVFTELAAAATGQDDWGITGVTQRSASVRDQLMPQDGLYSVLERGVGAAPLRVVGTVRDVVFGGGDPAAVVDRIADPAVRLVTLTVTEKGYRRDGTGRLDRSDPEVAADLGGQPPRTVVGQLVRGLQHRLAHDAGPVTVLSCDNLVGNGDVLRGLVQDFVDALPSSEAGGLADWIASSVRFPSCMVDRIVPATTDEDRADVLAVLGLEDRGVVVAEPFSQWVIEDDFAADRPAWQRAGAVLTNDVAAWEAVKLRMLNASHSLLAYLGALSGYDTIAAALSDDRLAAAAEALMVEDVTPTLQVPDGLDLDDYRCQVLTRFANPALRHRTVQVAMDGSQKLPVRLLGTVRDRLSAGAVPRYAALAVAAWMVYVAQGRDVRGRDLPLDDPMADRLRTATAGAGGGPGRVVDSLLRIPEIFGADLAEHDGFRAALVEHVGRLMKG